MNVTFFRGLFDGFKQVVAYDFEEAFTARKFLEIIEVLEDAGLKVRANVNLGEGIGVYGTN